MELRANERVFSPAAAEIMAKVKFVNMCRSMKNFGVMTFNAKEVDHRGKKTPIVLGFTSDAILRIHPDTQVRWSG
jgi:hypothetical protein